MVASDEQKFAYILLIELIAHQFASPVRWVETQDLNLIKRNAERIIEVGPARTLVNMVRQSAKALSGYDNAHSLRWKYLSASRDKGEVYCDIARSLEEKATILPPTSSNENALVPQRSSKITSPHQGARRHLFQTENQGSSAHSAQDPSAKCQEPATPLVSLPDRAVDTELILEAIIKEKTAKLAQDFVWDTDIKMISSGRSVLKNEIIGDLLREFGNAPGNASDISMRELCNHLQEEHAGGLGKVSRRLITRSMVSKLPQSWGIAPIRAQLDRRLGFENGRQDIVLLQCAIATFSKARLSEPEAKQLVESVWDQHWKSMGISSERPGTSGYESYSAARGTLSPAQRNETSWGSKRGTDVPVVSPQITELTAKVRELNLELQKLRAEHDSTYWEGILGMFDARKVRAFKSQLNLKREKLASKH